MKRSALAFFYPFQAPKNGAPTALLAKATKPLGISDPRGPLFLLLVALLSGCATIGDIDFEERERRNQDRLLIGSIVNAQFDLAALIERVARLERLEHAVAPKDPAVDREFQKLADESAKAVDVLFCAKGRALGDEFLMKMSCPKNHAGGTNLER